MVHIVLFSCERLLTNVTFEWRISGMSGNMTNYTLINTDTRADIFLI